MSRISKISQAAFALFAAAVALDAVQFSFTTIDPPGSTFTFPFGINP